MYFYPLIGGGKNNIYACAPNAGMAYGPLLLLRTARGILWVAGFQNETTRSPPWLATAKTGPYPVRKTGTTQSLRRKQQLFSHAPRASRTLRSYSDTEASSQYAADCRLPPALSFRPMLMVSSCSGFCEEGAMSTRRLGRRGCQFPRFGCYRTTDERKSAPRRCRTACSPWSVFD